jgi:hypothetical protein
LGSAANVIVWLAVENREALGNLRRRVVSRVPGLIRIDGARACADEGHRRAETVHTLVVSVLKATASPELAVAETVNGAAPNVLPAARQS